jgi:hypothetical protein
MSNLEPRYILVKVKANMTTQDILTAIIGAFDSDNHYRQVQQVLAVAIGNDQTVDLLDTVDLEPLATDSYQGAYV